jgi:hypothetical protein
MIKEKMGNFSISKEKKTFSLWSTNNRKPGYLNTKKNHILKIFNDSLITKTSFEFFKTYFKFLSERWIMAYEFITE